MSEQESPLVRQLRVLWRHPIHIAAALLIGAVGAFVYSWGPLHRAEQWKIGYLEERVDEQNRTIREMEDEMVALRAETSSQPDPKDLAAEREAAKKARRELASAQKEAARHEATIKSLRRSVSQWKSKAEKADAEIESLRASLVAADSAAPPSGAGASASVAPPSAGAAPDGPAPPVSAPVAAPEPAEVP